jgi:hypothetical protein
LADRCISAAGNTAVAVWLIVAQRVAFQPKLFTIDGDWIKYFIQKSHK